MFSADATDSRILYIRKVSIPHQNVHLDRTN